MERHIIDTPIIDPHLDSYENFFDHDWSKRMFQAVENSPLENAIDALMIAWRSTNGAHVLPWLMVQSLKGFAEGEDKGSLRYRADYSATVIKGIVDKLDSRMQYSLNREQRAVLKRVVAKIEEEAFQAMRIAQAQCQFDVTDYWNSLTNTTEFHFCILGTQRINYGSLFFAYEDFLANTIRTKEPTYTSKKEPIKTAFSRLFGDPLTDFCWNHEEVDLARLVRHALAHNGGRFGHDLQKYTARFIDTAGTSAPLLRGDQFILVDGKIQVTPGNTRHLFGLLKERVSKIAKEVA